jgi:hypothetical protein
MICGKRDAALLREGAEGGRSRGRQGGHVSCPMVGAEALSAAAHPEGSGEPMNIRVVGYIDQVAKDIEHRVNPLADYRVRGNCVIRSVFSAEDAATIKAGAREVYRYILGSPEPKVGANTLHLSDVAKQQPRWMEDFVLWIIARFTKSKAFALYEELYGNYIAFPLLKCIVRFQAMDHVESLLPYHQDATPSLYQHHITNCWTALDPAGRTAPGVEVINAPLTEMCEELFMKVTLDKAGEAAWQAKYDQVMERFGSYGVTRPEFSPGDGIVFDHLAMHRTYFDPSMTDGRMSIEIRACSAEMLHRVYGEVDRVTVRRKDDGTLDLFYARPFAVGNFAVP